MYDGMATQVRNAGAVIAGGGLQGWDIFVMIALGTAMFAAIIVMVLQESTEVGPQ